MKQHKSKSNSKNKGQKNKNNTLINLKNNAMKLLIKRLDAMNLDDCNIIYDLISVVVKNNKIENLKNIKKFEKLLKKTKSGNIFKSKTKTKEIFSVDILCAIFEILKKSPKKKSEYKNIIGYHIKVINNAIHEQYLLISKKANDVESFNIWNNVKFLSFCEEFAYFLAEYDCVFESEQLFKLKSKIELGVFRYFINIQEEVIINNFDLEGNYTICDVPQVAKIISLYNFDHSFTNNFYVKAEDYVKEEIEKLKNEKNKDIDVESILCVMGFIAKRNENFFDKSLENMNEYLKFFPERIVDRDKFKLINNICKSLFSKKIDDYSINKKEEYMVNINSLKIAILILELKNDG